MRYRFRFVSAGIKHHKQAKNSRLIFITINLLYFVQHKKVFWESPCTNAYIPFSQRLKSTGGSICCLWHFSLLKLPQCLPLCWRTMFLNSAQHRSGRTSGTAKGFSPDLLLRCTIGLNHYRHRHVTELHAKSVMSCWSTNISQFFYKQKWTTLK